jgi:lytic murein transglycosylase
VNFDRWLADFKNEAAAKGISPGAIAAAAPYLRFEQRIVNIDRGQRFFAQDFLKFSDRMVVKYRVTRGAQLVKKHATIFAAIERDYGVPAPVIVAFWALESDFGANMGKDRVLPSLTTLAYDCRRSEMFRQHLFDALRLIERGDLRPEEMIGSWAGELGQTQFMPSEYLRNAVDYDGNGRRDLLKNVPDMLASTGKYLLHLGWRRGEPWLEEVRVPDKLPWDQADLDIKHPRSQWRQWGVTRASGRPLPADNLPASLVLPMGRDGPAFLAYANFQAYLQWNNSLIYSISAGYLATRIAGAPPMNRGKPGIPVLSFNETRELQQLLARRGHDVGRVDGIMGSKTRDAVKIVQKKLGLPADSYPTPELLTRLRQGR